MKKIEMYNTFRTNLEEEMKLNIDKYIKMQEKGTSDYLALFCPLGFILILVSTYFLGINLFDNEEGVTQTAILLSFSYVGLYLLFFWLSTSNNRKNVRYQEKIYEYIKENFNEKEIGRLLSKETMNKIKKFIKNNEKKCNFDINILSSKSIISARITIRCDYGSLDNEVLNEIYNVFDIRIVSDSILKYKYTKIAKDVLDYLFIKNTFTNIKYLEFYDLIYNIRYNTTNSNFCDLYNINVDELDSIANDFMNYYYDNRPENKTYGKDFSKILWFSCIESLDIHNSVENVLYTLKKRKENIDLLENKYPYNMYDDNEKIAFKLMLNEIILSLIANRIEKDLDEYHANELKKEKERKLYNQSSYKNHCWNCRVPLSSNTNERCPKCGWYICKNCGACSVLDHNHK